MCVFVRTIIYNHYNNVSLLEIIYNYIIKTSRTFFFSFLRFLAHGALRVPRLDANAENRVLVEAPPLEWADKKKRIRKSQGPIMSST